MNKQERVTFVINTLKEFYPSIPVPLDHKDPYTLLIAVLLSAQCTDVRVNQITPLLLLRQMNVAHEKTHKDTDNFTMVNYS
jgi:endonuclease-3